MGASRILRCRPPPLPYTLALGVTCALVARSPESAASTPSPPAIAAWTPLSARPEAFAEGNSGPVNRIAFEVQHFAPTDPALRVLCVYPGAFVYRCPFEFAPETATARRRVVVDVPDLGRGPNVVVRFVTSAGQREIPIQLVNRPRVVHEIESLPLPGGGRTTVDGTGRSAPVLQLSSMRATTMPAIALTPLAATPDCDQLYAVWVTADATDPVFTSAFGALDGSVIPSRPAARDRPVRQDTAPEWLVTFPQGAQRVQFIAHYEVTYRVGECLARVVQQ